MKNAPLYCDVADGPDDASAWWIETSDGVRLRIGLWNRSGASGTVLFFPGRTEYIEKYGRAARHLADCGYATLLIDWRGQGLSDRLLQDPMSGHVQSFAEYQHDVAALVHAAGDLNLPRPWHLLAHSMGGCIGLRALMEGLDVCSCVFSGPMWGINISHALRPIAWSIAWSGRNLGLGHWYAPGTAARHYVLEEPFETNLLTSDREMYHYMIDQIRAHPELGLGGPSLSWAHEALKETRELAATPSPSMPCLTFLGSEEKIIDVARVRDRMTRWDNSQLVVIPNGRHETLMEGPETRDKIFQRICQFFSATA